MALLNTKQAAARLNISASWLEHARLEGRGPHIVRVGLKVMYRQEDLDAFIEANREQMSMKV